MDLQRHKKWLDICISAASVDSNNLVFFSPFKLHFPMMEFRAMLHSLCCFLFCFCLCYCFYFWCYSSGLSYWSFLFSSMSTLRGRLLIILLSYASLHGEFKMRSNIFGYERRTIRCCAKHCENKNVFVVNLLFSLYFLFPSLFNVLSTFWRRFSQSIPFRVMTMQKFLKIFIINLCNSSYFSLHILFVFFTVAAIYSAQRGY